MGLPKNYNYKPLPNYLKIGKSDIEGYGIFAGEDLKKDHFMNYTPTHVQMDTDEVLYRTSFGGWINHSDEPNGLLETLFEDGYTLYYFKTIKDISKGEELTLNYGDHLCGCEEDKLK